MPIASHYSPEIADGAVRFLSSLPHVKGDKAGQLLVLEDWQEDYVRKLFGTLRSNGRRLYRESYAEVPRKNGKSLLMAGIALYLLFADNEPGAEVYSAATTKEQACEVYDPAVAMVRQTPWLAKRCRIYRSPKMIYVESTNSKFLPIVADEAQAHGKNPHGIIFDELHLQRNRELWDAMQTGRGARLQPLTIAITTAGHDRSTICWEKHQKALAVRDGVLDDPTFLPLVYAADPDDDWTDEATWRKANPNYGVSVVPEYMTEECDKAKQSALYENVFRRLHLNQWTEQAVRWIKLDEWDAGREDIDWHEFDGAPAWCGMDLSSTRDVTAFVTVFRDEERYYVRPQMWIPEASASQRAEHDQQQVRNWAANGWVTETSGNEVHYEEVMDYIDRECQRFDVRTIAFDPWHSPGLIQRMNDAGFDQDKWRKFGQTVGNFAGPCRELERLLAGGLLRHDGNPALRWMASNVAAKVDPSGNVRPDKGKSGDKIDGIVAMLMAMGAALVDEDSVIGGSVCWVPGGDA